MPKKISEFLTGLARKSGVELTPEQVDYLKGGDFERIELADEIVTGIDNSLISLKDAKNNHSEIRNHYHKQVYDGFDASLNTLMDELEFGDIERNQVLTERNTNKRLPMLVKMVKDLENKKANADKPDKAAINKQLEDLNAQIRLEKENLVKATNDYERQLKEYRIDAKKDTLFMPYKTIHDGLDPEVKATIIRTVLNKHLQDNQAQLTFDDNNNFVLQKKDGTNYFGDNNQQVSPVQLMEQILSRNKFLLPTPNAGATPAAGDTPKNGQNPNGGNANNGNGENGKANNHLLKDILANARKDISENARNPILGGGVGQ